MTCADTSFLISFYGDDVNSEDVRQFRTASRRPLHIHSLNDFELANALRTLVFRGKITASQRSAWLADYEEDKAIGTLIFTKLDANAVLRRADVMSVAWTETDGHRAYDILHIAAAKILGATEFWSFDGRQRTLAVAEGLAVGP